MFATSFGCAMSPTDDDPASADDPIGDEDKGDGAAPSGRCRRAKGTCRITHDVDHNETWLHDDHVETYDRASSLTYSFRAAGRFVPLQMSIERVGSARLEQGELLAAPVFTGQGACTPVFGDREVTLDGGHGTAEVRDIPADGQRYHDEEIAVAATAGRVEVSYRFEYRRWYTLGVNNLLEVWSAECSLTSP
jgi:hypothetical protein